MQKLCAAVDLEYLSNFFIKYQYQGQFQNPHHEQIPKPFLILEFVLELTKIFKMKDITLLSFHLFQGPIIIIVVAISHKWSLQFQFLYIISLIPGQPGTIGVEVDCLT